MENLQRAQAACHLLRAHPAQPAPAASYLDHLLQPDLPRGTPTPFLGEMGAWEWKGGRWERSWTGHRWASQELVPAHSSHWHWSDTAWTLGTGGRSGGHSARAVLCHFQVARHLSSAASLSLAPSAMVASTPP